MSDDDEWEYYDDTITLSDLWQNLKNESLEDDPVNFWLKTPMVDLQDAVFDYWRLKVPLVLAPSYGYTSSDQPVNQDIVRGSLLQPLEAFICGSGNTREVFEVRTFWGVFFSKNRELSTRSPDFYPILQC